jgi:Protein of unknown function (DUF3551)
MRLLLFVLGGCVGIACSGTRAEAQNYPWCAQYKAGAMNCGFMTFQQCLATVSEAGLASKTIHTSRRPDHVRKRGSKGAILSAI